MSTTAPELTRKPKVFTARVIGFIVLGAAAMFALAAFIGFLSTGEQRSYTGAVTVVDAHWTKICTVKVAFPDGSQFGYSFDTSKTHCDSLTPGMNLMIDHGTVTNAPATGTP